MSDEDRSEAIIQMYDEAFEVFTREVIGEVVRRRRNSVSDEDYWANTVTFKPGEEPW